MKRDSESAKVRKYLRLLENPYASLQVVEIADEHLATNAQASDSQGVAPRKFVGSPTQVDLFALQRPQPAAIIYTRHGNPYAGLANIDDDGPSVVETGGTPGQDPGAISQTAFETGCRRIFAQYIPRLSADASALSTWTSSLATGQAARRSALGCWRRFVGTISLIFPQCSPSSIARTTG